MDTSNSNDGLRDGRVITVGVVACALLLSAACVSPAITAFEIDEASWQRITTTRFLFVWATVSFGLVFLAVSIFTSIRRNLILTAASAMLGLLAAIYPSGIQLIAGPLETSGRIESVVVEGTGKRFRVLPASKTVSTEQSFRLVAVTMIAEDGDEQVIRVLRQDLTDEMPASTGVSQWRFRYLPYLNRLVFAERLE